MQGVRVPFSGQVFHGFGFFIIHECLELSMKHQRFSITHTCFFVENSFLATSWSFLFPPFLSPRSPSPESTAWNSYQALGGYGNLTGDGLVPVDWAHLPGAQQLTIKDCLHSIKHCWNYTSNQQILDDWWTPMKFNIAPKHRAGPPKRKLCIVTFGNLSFFSTGFDPVASKTLKNLKICTMDFCQWTPCRDLEPSTSGSYLCETFVDKWLQEVLVALNDAKLKTVAKWCKPCASKSISRKKSYYLLIFYQGFLPHLLVGSFTKPIWRFRPETCEEPEEKKQRAAV